MTRQVWSLYAGFGLLAALIYFGTDVKSNNQKTLEKSRVLIKQSKSTQVLLRDAYHTLDNDQKNQIDEMNVLLEREEDESSKMGMMERLAGMWYNWGHYDVSGHYAEKIAEARNTAEAWAIAGTTYSQGIQAGQDDRTKQYCADKARAAFDQAKLIQPDNPNVDLNRALTFIYRADESNPMAGIQMLLQLKNQYPDYAPVYRNLGRLANQTGQFEKALERLRTAWALEGDRAKVSCLLEETFVGLGIPDSIEYYSKLCKN
jgi:tetratricopeptide (TPR) repeat protein